MPAEPTPQSIGIYSVESVVGRAGQTAVYRCVDPRTRDVVAVKVFPRRLSEDAELAARFRAEVAELQQVTQHPDLVRILATGQQDDRIFLAMEWFEGPSLDRFIRGRRLLLPEVFAIMKGICRALVYAHGQGKVHGALTPRSVLLSPDLQILKLSDLGMAPFEGASASTLTATLSTGEIRLGALYYLAPETMEGSTEADPRSDLYSAGAIFHQLLTGHAPGPRFGLPSQVDTELPQEVDPLPLRCLARIPADRYPSAAALLVDIERVEEDLRLRLLTEIRGLTLSGSQLPGTGADPKPGRSLLFYLGLLSALLAALGLVGFLLMR